jgi:hypothetical protein
LRIALAVPAFVVAQDQRRHRIRERHGADDVGADLRVDANFLELLLRQGTRLRQDVLGHRELADVVQQRRGLDALNFRVGHAEPARDARGIDLDTADMRLRGLIFRVDRERQRFDGGQVQVRHFLNVTTLVVDATEVNLVGAVGEVERRRGQQRQPHARGHHRPGADRRGARADEVARRAPQEVLVPHRQERLFRGERYRDSDQAGVEHEIHRRCADERAGEARHIMRERARHAAEPQVGEAGGLHGDCQARHAEQGPVSRIFRLHPEGALAPCAGNGNEHGLVRTEQQQRCEIDRVRHRHRRAALGEREADLERGSDCGGQQQNDEERNVREVRLRSEPHNEAGADCNRGAYVKPGCERQSAHSAGIQARRGALDFKRLEYK